MGMIRNVRRLNGSRGRGPLAVAIVLCLPAAAFGSALGDGAVSNALSSTLCILLLILETLNAPKTLSRQDQDAEDEDDGQSEVD